MRQNFPGFAAYGRCGRYVFKGNLQPTARSPQYRIRIEYCLDEHPRVFVVAPEIEANAPHRYKDKSLCLFHPKNFDWTNSCLLAKYTVPWAAAWLMFYEIWLKTGKWFADAEPHGESAVLNVTV
jgi:hypothetical protein